jgi:DNA polymerase I-like protein with 3'-5' exonuclease and polymerase domains
MTKTEVTRFLKRDISPIKSQLLSILSKMERDGLKRDADQLGSIIARLEDFQNR